MFRNLIPGLLLSKCDTRADLKILKETCICTLLATANICVSISVTIFVAPLSNTGQILRMLHIELVTWLVICCGLFIYFALNGLF